MNAFTMIDSNRLGQYISRARAKLEAKKLTQVTGRPHYAMLNTCYRVNIDGMITPRLCWTVRMSAGRFRDILTASKGSYLGPIACVT